MIYNVEDIANLILLCSEDKGELMTNMKLQKMLYYQQGFHLAYFDEPLFNDDIEAWMYGPVVSRIYHKYKDAGKNGIPGDKNSSFTFENSTEAALFNEVNKVYGRFSAIGLMEMTHSEKPWKSVPTCEGSIISKTSIQSFFRTRLKK